MLIGKDRLLVSQKCFVENLIVLKKIAFNLILIIFFPLLTHGQPDGLLAEIEAQVHTGIEQTLRNDFVGAESTFTRLINRYPERPCGYFYLAATYQAEILDAEDYRELPRFKKLMDTAIQKAEALRSEEPPTPWVYFMEGSAYLYKSFMDSKTGRIWGAYRNALRGVDRLNKAIGMDSTFYDAYLGVGSYRYWKSRKAKSLTWLPFLKDEREQGLRMVRTAIEKGSLVKYVGKDQLAWIEIDRGNWEEALALALENHRRYPESRFFMWTLTEIYYKSQKWKEAMQWYQRLLKIVRALPENNHYNEATCLLRIAEIYAHFGDYRTARLYCQELLQLHFDKDVRKRVKKKIEQAKQLKKRCEKKLAG